MAARLRPARHDLKPAVPRSPTAMYGHELRHRGGKIVYPGQITGMYILLNELKRANPALEIRGC
jgi:hypothetical protein